LRVERLIRAFVRVVDAIRSGDQARRNKGYILDAVLAAGDNASMAKVTGKLQITLPKALAELCGIQVGDELELRPIGKSIQIDRRSRRDTSDLRRDRLAHFDQASTRQRNRERRTQLDAARTRGWTRAELYTRGRTR
jgi:bifunctional DNA-binding transcriptional regulator/antitoxin component of YhaV-PrlF toxin-antitoxin module